MEYIKFTIELLLAPIIGLFLIALTLFTGLVALPFELLFGEK